MLIATTLVMIMTPGLAFFYGGLVNKKNVLTVMMQSYVSMGVSTILWVVVGYSLSFSGDVGGIIGNLDKAFLRGIGPSDLYGGAEGTIPLLLFVVYLMMFAVITPALYRCLCRPNNLQGLLDFPSCLADYYLLPLLPHDMGWSNGSLPYPILRCRLL
jgi:hypothetical protein